MRGVVWVDKDGLGLTVIVVLVVVLLGLPGNVGGGVSRVLTSGGKVVLRRRLDGWVEVGA